MPVSASRVLPRSEPDFARQFKLMRATVNYAPRKSESPQSWRKDERSPPGRDRALEQFFAHSSRAAWLQTPTRRINGGRCTRTGLEHRREGSSVRRCGGPCAPTARPEAGSCASPARVRVRLPYS